MKNEENRETGVIKRAFVDLPEGQVHYRTAGNGINTVLLLHQTPRSSDEFLDVIPALSREFRVIAIDTIGYGDSYKPSGEPAIQDYAKAAISVLDKIGVSSFSVVGHHTGAVIAFELAVSYPERVEKLVLSNSPYLDEAKREKIRDRPPIDVFPEIEEDGSQLLDIWNRRRSFYPEGRPDLFLRYVFDVLKAGNDLEAGHLAASKYDMEDKIGKISCPTLVMCGTDDPYSFPDMEELHKRIKGSISVAIPGGMVPIVDQMPDKFSVVAIKFLKSAQGVSGE